MNERQNTSEEPMVNQKYLKLIQLGTGEKVLCYIKKHPIGLVPIYAFGFFVSFALIVVGAASGMLINKYVQLGSALPGIALASLLILLGLVSLFFTYVAGFIYRNNVIILTNEKIAQVTYKNLVDRKVTQISLGELEDVSVSQAGLLARGFEVGTLSLETAGEMGTFDFTFVPFPHKCANDIVRAHEQCIKKYGN